MGKKNRIDTNIKNNRFENQSIHIGKSFMIKCEICSFFCYAWAKRNCNFFYLFSRIKCAHTSAREPKIIAIWNQFFFCCFCCLCLRICDHRNCLAGIHGLQIFGECVCIDHCSKIVNVDQQIAFTYRLARSFFIDVVVVARAQERYGQPYSTCEPFASHISFFLLLLLLSFWFLISHKIPLCVHVNYEECFFFFYILFLLYAQFSANVCSILAK